MANSTLTADIVLKEAKRLFLNNLVFLSGMKPQYDDTYRNNGAKSGTDIRIRRPMKYRVSTGAVADIQDNTESSVTLSRSTQKHIALNFTSQELTTDLDNLSNLYLKPAMHTLAADVDLDCMNQCVNQVYNTVGTPGTDPASMKVHLDAGAKMDNFATPRDGMRSNILNPNAQASTVDALKGLFQDSGKIRSQYNTGFMGTGLGYEFAMSQSVPNHTNGAYAGTVQVNDTVVSGDSNISLDGFTDLAPTVKKGDVFTIAGVFAVNPVTKVQSSELQEFVVTADTTGGSNAITDVPVSPSFITTDEAQKTVSALPVDGAAITFRTGDAGATHAQNLAYHENTFAFGSLDLEMPNVAFKSRDTKGGISMRLVEWYDGVNDTTLYRLDVLYGIIAVTPENACRIIGA